MERNTKLSMLALLLGGLTLPACSPGNSIPADTGGDISSTASPTSTGPEHSYSHNYANDNELFAVDDTYHGNYCAIHGTYENLSEHHMGHHYEFSPYGYIPPSGYDQLIYFPEYADIFKFTIPERIYYYCKDGCGYGYWDEDVELEEVFATIGQIEDKEAFVQSVEEADLSEFDYAKISDYPNGERSGIGYHAYRAKPDDAKEVDWLWCRQAYVNGPFVFEPEIQHTMNMFKHLVSDHLEPHLNDFEIYDIGDYYFVRGSYGDYEIKIMYKKDFTPFQYHYIEKENGEIVKNEGKSLFLGHSEDTLDGVPDFSNSDRRCWNDNELSITRASFYKATIPGGSFIGPMFGLVKSVRNEQGEMEATTSEFSYGQLYGCYSIIMRQGDNYTFGYAVNSRYDTDPYGTIRYAEFTGEEGLAEAQQITKPELNTKTKTKDNLGQAYTLSPLVSEIDEILEKVRNGKYTILANEYEPAKFEYYIYYKDGSDVWVIKPDYKEYYVFDEDADFSDFNNAHTTYIASSGNFTSSNTYRRIINHLTGLWTHN